MGKPKYIIGFSSFTDSGVSIELAYARDHGYDVIANIKDVTPEYNEKGLISYTYQKDKINILYRNSINNVSHRDLRITFLSGEKIDLKIFVPITEQKTRQEGGEASFKIQGWSKDLQYFAQGNYGPRSMNDVTAYAMMPVMDPYNRFSNGSAWQYSSESGIVKFSSEVFNDGSGRPKDGPAVQYAHFAAVLGKGGQFNSADEVWEAAFSGEKTIYGFIYTSGLQEIGPGAVVFNVCGDPDSPSYYRKTGLDSSGNTIPSEYMMGQQQAIFKNVGCAVDPTYFQVGVVTERAISPETGKIRVAVGGNQKIPRKKRWTDINGFDAYSQPADTGISNEDFTYELELPDGTSQTSGVITGNIYSFEGLKESSNPYIVSVTDDTGAKIRIPVIIEGPIDRNCFCGDPEAINYSGITAESCLPCITCKGSTVQIDGRSAGHQFMVLQNFDQIPASSHGNNDGALSFSSEIHSDILTYLGNYASGLTYEIELYSTSSNGGSLDTLIESRSASGSNDADFYGLEPGWYAIRIGVTGHGCESIFYKEITYQRSIEPCASEIDVEFHIDSCTGTVSASVDSDIEHRFLFSNGGSFSSSLTVSAGDQLSINVIFPSEDSCTGFTVGPYQITESMLDCPEVFQTVGCTDPTALNYDPSAVIDAGTCVYGKYGCTDPEASNYDPLATVDDGSCFNACPQSIMNAVVVDGSGVPSVIWASEPSNYTITWTEQLTGTVLTSTTGNPSFSLPSGVWVISVEDALGCKDEYIIGTGGSQVYYGCTDPLAVNFHPGANVPYSQYDESYPGTVLNEGCKYRIEQSKCIPHTLQQTLEELQKCISRQSDRYLNLMKAGRLTPCTENSLRTLHIIDYLLRQRGSECVFNCMDMQTPDPFEESCVSKWKKPGPSGSGLVYNPNVQYQWGDMVKSATTELIYTVISQSPVQGVSTEDPTAPQYYRLCNDLVPSNDVVNRLDPMLAKVKDICLECGINIDSPSGGGSVSVSDNTSTMEGDEFTINGSGLDMS